MSAPAPCPDRCRCAALVALGYLVVHAAPGELFGLLALANDHTLKLCDGWLATMGEGAGLDPEDVRAVALDRGGRVL